MGLLNGDVSVDNRTPYQWTICIETQNPWLFADTYDTFEVDSYSKDQRVLTALTLWRKTIYLRVKYGQHTDSDCCHAPDLWYICNPRDDPCFRIEESEDRRQIHLNCSVDYEQKKSSCPNYGKIEDDTRLLEANQRREEEEQRRQAQLELERRIEEQIKRQSEISAKKLSQATENLEEQLRSREVHHQTQIMQQPLHICPCDKDEVAEMEEMFMGLLSKYEIIEDEDMEETELSERIKTLQNETMVDQCRRHGLSSSCLFSFDSAVGYETLGLRDRWSVLEAVLCFVCGENEEEHELKSNREFVLNILRRLQNHHPTLALRLLQNILQTDLQLSPQSKEILGQMLFSNLWTQAEITEFIQNPLSRNNEEICSLLHVAQTYKLKYHLMESAMTSLAPLKYLQRHVENERQKDARTIVGEIRGTNCPENVVTVLEDVLTDLEQELLERRTPDLSNEEIQNIKELIQELDLKNPDRWGLKRALMGLSAAVKMGSAVTITKGKEKKVIEGYLPRLTQIASLIVFLLPKSGNRSGCLLQIGTGEGKSCTLAMFATFQAIRGVKVDVVTSSPVLARRDFVEWRRLYELFGITSSVVPPPSEDMSPEKLDELIQESYKQQIVYSTVGTFAADVLKQEFERKTTRGDRGFELVLVDEVDYMTLDNGVQITFLSHESSGLQHLEQILAAIWTRISGCRPIQMAGTGEIMWTSRIQNFHTAALRAMIGSETTQEFSPLEILLPGIELGFYSEEEFKTLRKTIIEGGANVENDALRVIMKKTGVEQQYDLLTVLEMAMDEKVAFDCYLYQPETKQVVRFGENKTRTDQNIDMLLLENGRTCEILSEALLVEGTVSEMKSRIHYSTQDSSPETGTLIVPWFLQRYLEHQLPLFVKNALRAVQMSEGREYMIERSISAQGIEVSDEDEHMYHAIIPVDFQASGMLEKRKRWGDGLQQFLEMKHQLALSSLTNVTNYMSNSNFFKRYLRGRGIFGVSGTLGGPADKDFLVRHYRTECYIIPAHQRGKVTELPAVQVGEGTEPWIQMLCSTISKVSARGQVTLVVCEDVNTANSVHEKISADLKPSVFMYTMSERHNIENHRFTEGQVIITTNLGGRGTDIKVTEEVNRRGGLFVLLTYFPNNRRVERQVFGRTGRKGAPGMVQLILNQEQLTTSYQDLSIELMRELREEDETQRIRDMEKEKLVEVEMKEELFSTFCRFLSDFEKNYEEEERIEFFKTRPRDVPQYFRSFHSKMDYHPALNALKESWAEWLTLHTVQITTRSDITGLNNDLMQHLRDVSDQLLQGESTNFHDHIQQALGRTALYFQNKSQCDYGAQTYWDRACDSAPYYRAAALYNRAYIIINMAHEDYKPQARALLREAEQAINNYVLETTNTLSLCSTSICPDFEPHHRGSCNFQTQMQARMNIFSSWKRNISKILDMLGCEGDFLTVDLALFSLSAVEDFVSTGEFNLVYNHGLALVFDVKEKPKFPYDALICCFIGLVQVVIGVLICTMSDGIFSSLARGFIFQGVDDIIRGINGMINGNFTWASWAITKSTSIATAIFSSGLKPLSGALKIPASHLLNGATSLQGIVSSIQSGQKVFMSSSGSKSAALVQMGPNLARLNLKFAVKYAVQQLAVAGVKTGLNEINATVQKTFRQEFQRSISKTVCSVLESNREFVKVLMNFISGGIPKTALNKELTQYRVSRTLEKRITEHVDSMSQLIINELLMNCSQVQGFVKQLSRMWDKSAENMAQCPHVSTETLNRMFSLLPTTQTIEGKVVPAFIKLLTEKPLFETFDHDGRDQLKDVQRLKDDLIDLVSRRLSEALMDRFSRFTSSIFTKTFNDKLNSAAQNIVGNLLGRQETEQFFIDQQRNSAENPAGKCKNTSSSKGEHKKLEHYAKSITNDKQSFTDLAIYVLTKSNLLQGKGIGLTLLDAIGTVLAREYYPGTDPKAGVIPLSLTKTPVTSPDRPPCRTDGALPKPTETQTHLGNTDIGGSGSGNVPEPNQNCLFQAIVQATTGPNNLVPQKALRLRSQVREEILSNPQKYSDALKIQNMFNGTNKSNRYKFRTKLSEWEMEQKSKYLRETSPKQMVDDCKLGKVGGCRSLLAISSPIPGLVEISQIPPKSTWTEAFRLIRTDVKIASSLESNNKDVFDMLISMSHQDGERQLCMKVLYSDHRRALTAGHSEVARACRRWLTDTLVGGDTEKVLKLSLMMAHPECSENIRMELGIHQHFRTKEPELPVKERNEYYRRGFKEIVKNYSKWDLLEQRQSTRLIRWLNQDGYVNRSSPEYNHIIEFIKEATKTTH